jgi:hypothetical protein
MRGLEIYQLQVNKLHHQTLGTRVQLTYVERGLSGTLQQTIEHEIGNYN